MSAAWMTACSLGVANYASFAAGLIPGAEAIERSYFQTVAVIAYVYARKVLQPKGASK